MIIMNPVMRLVLIEHITNKVPDFVCDIDAELMVVQMRLALITHMGVNHWK